MKLILKIVGGLLALIIIAAIAIPMFISADFIKAQLQAQVKKATGRELQIKGAASISVLPNIAINVEDVTLGNPAGFAAPYLVHIDKLETGAALMPLLDKELRITGVTLNGAKLHLEETKSGAKNWEFVSAKPTGEAAEPATTQEKKESPLKALAIGRVTIKDTALYYNKAGAKPLAVEALNLSLDGADGASPLSLTGSANYQGQPVKVKLGVKESKALIAGKVSPLVAAITLPSGALDFDGTAQLGDAPKANGKFSFTSDNLGALMGWATGKKPAGNLPKKVSVKTQLGFAGMQAITAKELNFAADSLSGNGALVLNLAGAVPSINGELKFGEINLDTLTGKAASSSAASGAGEGKAAPASNSDGWSNAPLDLSGLRAANTNLKITTPKLTTGKLQFSNIAATVAMNGGKLNLGLGNLSLYGGAAKGTVTLDGSGSGAGVGSNLSLSGVDIEALMNALSGASKIKGTANVTLDVNGRGASQRALMSGLNGNGTLRVTDGAIKGINIASFLRDAKKGFVFGSSSTESTDFTELSATYKIVSGIVSNNDLAMKSPVLRLGGSGTISLPARTINYRAVPSIVGTLKGQGGKDKLSSGGLDVPLIITGPWSAISVTPDLEGMLTNALKDPAALQENLKNITGDIGKFNSPKDIGAALFGGKKKAPADAAAPPPTDSAPAPAAATPAPTSTAPASKEKQIQDSIGGLLNGLGK